MNNDRIIEKFEIWFQENARPSQKQGPGYRALMLAGYMAGFTAGFERRSLEWFEKAPETQED